MKYGPKNIQLREQAEASRLSPMSDLADARIVAAIGQVTDAGTVFYVIASIPSQDVDCYTVLIDDHLVIDFELERDQSNPQPLNVEIRTVSQFRQQIGQKGAHRLEATLAEATKALRELS